ncbi:Exodeoxyribonuclease 10 [Raoultella ornithinolytica]|nr:Exodeoxyribonuclease 10 [Raoultella ornithinolytica]
MLRVIDTETCGLQGGIVEIASVDIVDGQITNPMSHLVRPDRPISPQAMAIHRITEEMVADKPWIEEVSAALHRQPVVCRPQRQLRSPGVTGNARGVDLHHEDGPPSVARH